MRKKLIATDFDGTLYINGRIAGETRRAIDDWRAAGGYFGVVTGRGIDFYDTAKEQGLPFDYLIVYNGSLIVSQDKTVLYETLIPADIFAALEKAMAAYADIESFSESDGTPRHHYYATFPSAERALRVRDELLPVFGDKVSIFVNGPHINIGNKGTGKAQGVSFVLRHFGLPDDGAAVVGDDYNDLEMILAHNGWAVESGKTEVVSKAPHTCESVGGLIRFLSEQRTANSKQLTARD